MRYIKLLLFIIAGLVLVGVACLLITNARVKTFTTPTYGDKIAKYENPKKALLVIDIQEAFTGANATAPFPYKDSDNFILRANKVIEDADSKGIIPIYIIQEFVNPFDKIIWRGRAAKGKEGTRLDTRLNVKNNYIFSKEKSDAFSNKVLNTTLINKGVSELYILGLDAKGCVLKTSIGAINRGYKVNVIRDAIITQNINEMPNIIKTYEQEGIKVISSDEISDK